MLIKMNRPTPHNPIEKKTSNHSKILGLTIVLTNTNNGLITSAKPDIQPAPKRASNAIKVYF